MSRTFKDRPYWVKVKAAERENKLDRSQVYTAHLFRPDDNEIPHRFEVQTFPKGNTKAINEYVADLTERGLIVKTIEGITYESVCDIETHTCHQYLKPVYRDHMNPPEKAYSRCFRVIKTVTVEGWGVRKIKAHLTSYEKIKDVQGSLPPQEEYANGRLSNCRCDYCSNRKKDILERELNKELVGIKKNFLDLED